SSKWKHGRASLEWHANRHHSAPSGKQKNVVAYAVSRVYEGPPFVQLDELSAKIERRSSAFFDWKQRGSLSMRPFQAADSNSPARPIWLVPRRERCVLCLLFLRRVH